MENVREELNRLDAQRAALDAILRGYELLERTTSENGVKQTRQLSLGVPGRGGEVQGSISFSKGLVEVIQQARGEPLHAKVIWERMQEIGVKSKAKRPMGFVSLVAGKYSEIEKAGASTFRWIGPTP